VLRIAVSGYYGFNNPGDEAILLALVSTLKTLAPGVEITVFSHRPRETRQTYGVKAVNRWNPFSVLWAIWRSDLLLSGGGGLLQDVTGVRSIFYYLGIVLLAKILGRPVIYYAQGVGPVRTRIGRWLTRVISNKVELITVRDEASREDFLKMGVTRPPVVVTADPVLALNPSHFSSEDGVAILEKLRQECREYGLSSGSENSAGENPGGNTGENEEMPQGQNCRSLGIVIRDWQDYQEFKRVVAAVADRLVDEGWEIVLVPFHFPLDLQPCREVAAMMRKPCLLVRSRLSVKELFSLLGKLDLVVGMRLHSLVIASVMRTPCVGISYDPKVESFLELTGQPVAGTVADLEPEKLYQTIVSTWEKRQEIVNHLDQLLVKMRQQAWETTSLTLSVFYSQAPHRRGELKRRRRTTARSLTTESRKACLKKEKDTA